MVSVTIVDASVGHVIATLPAENVYELGFSPLGTYIITWQRPSKDEAGNTTPNLKVWRVLEVSNQPTVIGQFVQKMQTGWNLQYTADEKYCARAVTNEVQFFENPNLATVWKRLRVEGVSDFALSPGKSPSIAVFVPERKGMPAFVKIFDIPFFNSPVSQKSFFKSDKVQLKWNQAGTTLIVLAQTDVDKSGKSYYGETTMYLLSTNGVVDQRVTLSTSFALRLNHANLPSQTRMAPSTMFRGRRHLRSLVLSMAMCHLRRLSSTGEESPNILFLWPLAIL